MKAQLIGAAVLAAALAGCGGKASFTVGGTISGLNNDGLVLQVNGGSDLAVAAGATTFSFPDSISYGTDYTVTFKSQPAHMTCGFLGGTNIGSAGHTTTINVVISCSQNSYTLGGTVATIAKDGTSGAFSGDKLVLVNGSNGQLTIATGATTFTMPGTIPVGTSYGLSVFTQPTGQTCTISNGSNVMGDAAVSNVAVSCQVQ